MSDLILTLNAGSSSIKFSIYKADLSAPEPEILGKVAGIGRAPSFSAKGAQGEPLDKGALATIDPAADHRNVIDLLLPWLVQMLGNRTIVAVGHRVVHGGTEFKEPVLVTSEILDRLETFVPLAPLHQPHNLGAIRIIAERRPHVPQFACFDTSFHRTQPRVAEVFALPRALTDDGIQRFGFHGLSYDYIASALPEHLGNKADGRVVIAHLGNGSSMCAMTNRQSAATSMGFTALDGLVMGRRSGTVDPGVILYLMQSKGMDAADIEDMLYRKSGLLGVSGISNNMQDLQESNAASASEAIELYSYRAASVLSGFLPAIGGLDAIVFTAGIGENSALVRKQICDQLAWLGVELDADANQSNATRISTPNSKIDVLVLPTNEEIVVARACNALLS